MYTNWNSTEHNHFTFEIDTFLKYPKQINIVGLVTDIATK